MGAVAYVLETWVCRVDVVVLVAILGGGGYMVYNCNLMTTEKWG